MVADTGALIGADLSLLILAALGVFVMITILKGVLQIVKRAVQVLLILLVLTTFGIIDLPGDTHLINVPEQSETGVTGFLSQLPDAADTMSNLTNASTQDALMDEIILNIVEDQLTAD